MDKNGKPLKNIFRSILSVIILWILWKEPMHGYDIISKIFELTGFKFNAGVIYPILYQLEESKLIKGEWKQVGIRQRIKLYKITENGIKILQETSSRLQNLFKSL
ncbi:MAG: PadR family transcriptional regulator, partial [Nitrososphaerota archaeon]